MSEPRRRAVAGPVIAVMALLAMGLSGCGDDGGPDPELPSDAKVLVILGLRRDDRGLAAAVRRQAEADSLPLEWPTMDEIADRWGASAATRRTVLDRLTQAGVTGRVDASGGAVWAVMNSEQAHDVFGEWPTAVRDPDGSLVAELSRLDIPDDLQDDVTDIAGGRTTVETGDPAPVPGSPTTPACGAASPAGRPTPIGAWYGTDDYLFATPPERGAGQRVGILAIGVWSDAALDAVVDCYGTRPTGAVRTRSAPATPELPVGPEVTLDVVVAASFAPDADLDVIAYDPAGSLAAGFLAAVDTTGTAPYTAVSTSIGYCETDLEGGEVALTEHALLALAAVGTTVVAASGDTGSAACAPDSDATAVQYPASSPWIAGIGGTTVRGSADVIDDEIVWSDGAGQAGGGGTSDRFDRPWFQHELDPKGAGPGRLVPDVAFLADPGLVPPVPICSGTVDSCEWYALAGTSAPAPALAAGLALVGGALTRAGGPTRIGLLAPLVGRLAEDDPEGVHDVVDGSNRVGGNGCCDAGPGYDLASGWGSLRLPALAQAITAS